MSTADPLLDIAQQHLLGNYRQAPFVLDRGQGCELFDTQGRRYLDLCAGVAVAALGHGHPGLSSAIAEQAARLMHVSNYFYNKENLLLASELCAQFNYDRVFFCNSGTEANEAMLKLCRRWFYVQGKPEKTRIIAFHHSFHGRTMGAVALTGTPKYREGFGPSLSGVSHVDYGDSAAVKAAMGPDVAGIIVEPMLGEGGVLPPPEGFLKELRSIADEHGALLLLDEIQTGMGRTGKWLGSHHEGVEGDAMTLAKGLGGGFPIGVLMIRERYNPALSPGSHGSTFGGNALASAAARAVLRIVREEGLVEAAAQQGDYLGQGLAKLAKEFPKPCIGSRGKGLLQGLCLSSAVDPRVVLAKVRDHGVLVTIAGNTILRFSPPLIIQRAQIDEALERVGKALSEC